MGLKSGLQGGKKADLGADLFDGRIDSTNCKKKH
jgi:hypothetical protein